MIILSLRKKGNNVIIQFDDGSSILLDYKIVTDAGLRKNDIIDDSKKNELLILNEELKIKDAALKLLSRRLHSKYELINKLLKKNFDKKLIHEVVDELISKNFLNDYEFCKAYFEERFYRKKIGINKIKAELIKKGIDRKIIEDVIHSIDDNSSIDNAYELAKKKLNSYQFKKLDNQKIKQKLFSFLSSRGFQSDVIFKVIDKLNIHESELN